MITNNTTRLYQQLRNYLTDPNRPSEYFEELQDKMAGIFDIKEVAEYKSAMEVEEYTPAQFRHVTAVMKRSFVEGYLLAQLEQSRKEIKTLYNMYRREECQPMKKATKKDVKNS